MSGGGEPGADAPQPADAAAAPSGLPLVRRSWPPGRELAAGEGLSVRCGGCGADWTIHAAMAGFRLRCACGAWVDVPVDPARLPGPASSPAPAQLPSAALAPAPDERGLVHLHMERGATYDGDIPTALPMAPGALQSGNVDSRARWTNRALLEFALLFAAILGPQFAAQLLTRGQEGVLLLPFASLCSGLLVLCIAAVSGPYGTIGVRGAALARWGEAIAGAAVGYGLAWGWIAALRALLGADALPDDVLGGLLERLGPAWALVVIAASPALVEEIAFRGMLQGRLLALLGARNGLIATAMAFALAHVSPATIPIHLSLGLYLGWLRERSGSLLPGMLLHFSYNAAVLLLPF